MPYTGGTAFLRLVTYGLVKGDKKCVNALYGRDYISTAGHPYMASKCRYSGVNALYGRDCISTALLLNAVYICLMQCQCPIRAGRHFYLKRKEGIT